MLALMPSYWLACGSWPSLLCVPLEKSATWCRARDLNSGDAVVIEAPSLALPGYGVRRCLLFACF